MKHTVMGVNEGDDFASPQAIARTPSNANPTVISP